MAELQGLPSWLQTPPIAPLAPLESFMHGFTSGSAAAAQQAQRAQQAAQFSQELGQRQLKAQQDYELEQQGQQIRNQQLAQQLLHQRAMEARAMRNSDIMEARNAAIDQRAQATAAQLQQHRQAQQAGQAESRAETKRYHDYQMNKPETSKLFHVGNSLVRVNPDGTQEILFTSNDPSKLDQWEHSELMAGVNRAFRATGDMNDPLVKDAQQRLESFNKRVRSGGAKATESEVLPMPKSKVELQAGKMYQTIRGPAMWDGDSFVK